MVCKNISRTKDASYTKPLSDAGAVSALVKLLDVEKDLEDGSAELAALSLGRMGASDSMLVSKLIDCQGFDRLLQLLSTGCESARETAAKTLLYFADNREFAKLMTQVGGIAHVHTAMGFRGEDFDTCGTLLTIFIENSTAKDLGMSSIDRKLAKRNAELRNRVAVFREQRDDPQNRAKTPNVKRYLHVPRPTTVPDRQDLKSAGSSTFHPNEEWDQDMDDFDMMNGTNIPNLVPLDTAQPRSILTRGSVRTAGDATTADPTTADGRTTADGPRRVTFQNDDDSDDSDENGSDYDPRGRHHLPRIGKAD